MLNNSSTVGVIRVWKHEIYLILSGICGYRVKKLRSLESEDIRWTDKYLLYVPRNPLPAQTRRLPQVTLYSMWGKKFFFAPPLLYLWSSACAVHLLFSEQMNSCLPEQLLPGNWITGEENSCYPKSSLPGDLWYQSIIFSASAPCLS